MISSSARLSPSAPSVNPTDDVASLARLRIRNGEHTGHTAGMAPGYVQGNLVILPARYADDFRTFCDRNPKPCPLLAVGKVRCLRV
eukprot:2266118-Pyramimonas_sp.AAC.1